tara:strand:+ start:41 stop:652 length:612 start_codon:yes stop_codon:yes gene_type:complete
MLDFDSYSHLNWSGSWSIHNEEKPSWDYLKNYVEPGCVFLDIGCQKGIYSQGCIDICGEDCTVYGFDVLEHSQIKELEKNNKNFKFFHKACGDGEPHDVVVHYDSNTVAPAQETIKLDDFADEYNLKKIDVIKMDVDGCEFPVLRGMTNILEKFSPVLMIEIESDLENIKEFLKQYGYKYLYSRNGVNRFFAKNDSYYEAYYG